MKFLSVLLTLSGLFIAIFAAPANNKIHTDNSADRSDGPHVMCTNGEVICAAAADNGYDGGVFQCVDGRLVLIQDCTPLEKCFMKPTPHCAWPSVPL
ncbi:hypothetical protein J1614_001628 [Plenodomus biglobosus]|nr:hypothetical protein J1614_001628 [Plenodomus biglobosus]